MAATMADHPTADNSVADSTAPATDTVVDTSVTATKRGRGWRFWAMFPGFCIGGLLVAIDATILTTVLPTIANELDTELLYVWAINGYFVSQTAVQPLYGQLSNIFGRRWPMIVSVLLFTLGSGLCGGATSIEMLITGRVVKGLGGGGINVMTEIIVADLVPLRERQKYMGIIFGVFAIGTFIGPVVGGAIVERTSWRWVFYINLPLCAVTLLLMVLFLNVRYDRETTIMAKLKRVDFVGNAILMASVVSVLLALTWGGTKHPWKSWRTLVPLLLGMFGLVGFMFFEGSKWCPEPTTPLRLFANRTAASTYVLSFLHGLILYWVSLMLPVYFQAVLEDSPEQSGIDLFASVIPMIPSAIAGGLIISATGRYKDLMVGAFASMAIGMGLFTLLTDKTTTVLWVVYQVVLAMGSGAALIATLPAILASLPESDVATATATWGFLRSFGSIWGVSIPATIFNTRFNQLSSRISSEALREMLRDGGAYQLATRRFLKSLDPMPEVKAEVVSAYVDSLKLVWQVGIAFTVIGVPVSLIMKSLKLRDELHTEFGYEESASNTSGRTEKSLQPEP